MKNPGQRWWMSEKGQAHTKVVDEWNSFSSEYYAVRQDMLKSYRHYSNKYYSAINNQSTSTDRNSTNNTKNSKNPMVINIIRNVIDTVVGKITKSPPKMTCLPQKNNPLSQNKALAVEKFVKAEFKDKDVYAQVRAAFRNAAITGTGFLKVVFDPNASEVGEITVDEILPTEIFYPPDLSIYGPEHSPVVYQIRQVNKNELAELYPDFKFEILSSNSNKSTNKRSRSSQNDYESNVITIWESWHKKTADVPQGRHVICIDNATLVDEDYDLDFLPIIPMFYNRPAFGAWGTGIAELIRSVQIELNMIYLHISQNMKLVGRPKWFVPKGSGIPPYHLNNSIQVIEYNGERPPSLETPQPVPPDLYQHADRLEQKGYQLIGLSQLSATSEKPTGLNSAIALQTQQDVESERFIELQQEYEETILELARRVVHLATKYYKREDNRTLKTLDKDSFELIAWNDLEFEDFDYELTLQPTSMLPDSKQGRQDYVLNLAKLGVIQDPGLLFELLNLPGEDKLEDSLLLDRKLADEYIYRLADPEEPYVAPDPYENHKVIYSKISAHYKKQRFSDLDQTVRQKFQRHLEERLIYLEKMQPNPMETQSQPMQNPTQGAQGQAQGQMLGGNPLPANPPLTNLG